MPISKFLVVAHVLGQAGSQTAYSAGSGLIQPDPYLKAFVVGMYNVCFMVFKGPFRKKGGFNCV